MMKKSHSVITLIGSGMPEVKVCDSVNGKPKVKQIERKDCIEFILRYSMFHKEIKRYDKRNFEQLQ